MDKKNYLTLVCFLLVLLMGCKKEDETLPEIKFLNPSVGASFSLPQTILVEAEISDDQRIDYVQIKILDEEFSSVAESDKIDVQQVEYQLSKGIVVDDPKIFTGKHYIKIIAFDGFNEKTAFREIYLNEIPNRRKGLFYVEDIGSQFRLMRTDSLFQNATVVDQFQDYADLEMINYFQTLVYAGYIEEDAVAYEPSTLDIKWTEVRPENPPNPSFTSLGENGQSDVLIGKNTAQIQRKHPDGTNKGTIDFDMNGWVAIDVDGNEDYAVAVWEEIATGNHRVEAYWEHSLQRAQYIDVNFEVVKVFAKGKTSEAFWVLGNESGSPVAYEWTFQGGLTPFVGTLPGGILKNAVQIRTNEYFLAYEDKVVYLAPSTNTAQTIVTIPGINDVSFDPANDVVIVAHDAGVSVINEMGSVIASFGGNPVVNVEAWMLK